MVSYFSYPLFCEIIHLQETMKPRQYTEWLAQNQHTWPTLLNQPNQETFVQQHFVLQRISK